MRGVFKDVHISSSWRGPDDQNELVLSGASRLQWPLSRHNAMKNGKPCSEALDLFFLISGVAQFPWKRYADINEWNQKNGESVDWGGRWKFVDGPHYELNGAALAIYEATQKTTTPPA
jgi:hypothetical protein